MKKNLFFRRKRFLSVRSLFQISVLFVFMFGKIPSYASSVSPDTLSLNMQNVKLERFVEVMKQKTGLGFLYDPALFQGHGDISVVAKGERWDSVLKRVLGKEGFTYTIDENVVVIKRLQNLLQEKKNVVIKGKIVDSNKQPLPGVTVLLKGTTTGTATDVNGEFSIVLVDGVKELIVTFVGMETQTVKLVEGKTDYQIVMKEDIKEMDEVVVTGYQVIDRRQLTSSITSVKAEDILVPGMTSIDQALEGRIPDLMVITNSGEVGATPRIRVRGTSTIIGNRQPLWVLDGVVLSDPVDVDPEDLNNPDSLLSTKNGQG